MQQAQKKLRLLAAGLLIAALAGLVVGVGSTVARPGSDTEAVVADIPAIEFDREGKPTFSYRLQAELEGARISADLPSRDRWDIGELVPVVIDGDSMRIGSTETPAGPVV